MNEFEETKLLANKILERPNCDPDDDLAMLSRQFLRQVETVERLKKELNTLHDPYRDHIQANRDEMLRKHQEAVERVRNCLNKARPDLALQVLVALRAFHPMNEESWRGWPEGS